MKHSRLFRDCHLGDKFLSQPLQKLKNELILLKFVGVILGVCQFVCADSCGKRENIKKVQEGNEGHNEQDC